MLFPRSPERSTGFDSQAAKHGGCWLEEPQNTFVFYHYCQRWNSRDQKRVNVHGEGPWVTVGHFFSSPFSGLCRCCFHNVKRLGRQPVTPQKWADTTAEWQQGARLLHLTCFTGKTRFDPTIVYLSGYRWFVYSGVTASWHVALG